MNIWKWYNAALFLYVLSACSFVFICFLQIGYYLDRGCPKWVGEDTQEEEEEGACRVISDKYASAAFLKYPVCSPIVLFQILYLINFKVCGNREIKYCGQFIDFSAIFLSVSIVSNARKGEGHSINTRKQWKKCANIGIFAIFKLVYNTNQ